MNNAEIEEICGERWKAWQQKLVEEHCTPVLTLGVGHDDKEGQVTICTIEEMSDAKLIIFLQGALNRLRSELASDGSH